MSQPYLISVFGQQIDLTTGEVTTLAGTGRQGNDKEGGAVGVAQELSSPWDLVMGKAPGDSEDDVIYIAMAGTHQLWVHFLQDTTWSKGRYGAKQAPPFYQDLVFSGVGGV